MSSVLASVDTKRLHLGCGKNAKPGWINLDQCDLPGVDVIANLDKCAEHRLPFEDNTFEEIVGNHVIEHIVNTLPFMQELHRISKPGAICLFNLPFGGSDDAWENPTHVRPYFIGSCTYFGQPNYFREDYNYRGDWNQERVLLKVRKGQYTTLTDPQLIFADIMEKRNIVVEMSVTLKCIKPIRAMDRALHTQPTIQFALI
jgi:SAM-dependent methyltransferase